MSWPLPGFEKKGPERWVENVEKNPDGTSNVISSQESPILEGNLRDWFAGMALAGLLSNPDLADIMLLDEVEKEAYRKADLMLAAREKKP